jgi:hypothetical protein
VLMARTGTRLTETDHCDKSHAVSVWCAEVASLLWYNASKKNWLKHSMQQNCGFKHQLLYFYAASHANVPVNTARDLKPI